MRKRKYFEKNGFVYGAEYKFKFGHWCCCVRKFTDYDEALKWITERGDFVTREFLCKSALRELRGNVLIKEWEE